MTHSNAPRQDVYTRITDKIIADLEQGVRPWMKPWNAEHAAGRITRPLRHNGQAYNGINVLMLWSAAVTEGYSAPIWMTFRQAKELGASVRKGEHGELVVYANTVTRTEQDAETGEELEHAIPFMKGYTVFNVEQIDGLPSHYYQLAEPVLDPVAAHRSRGKLLRRHRCHDPARRQSGLLHDRFRPHPDAALRELPRCRELLRDTGARNNP